MQGKHNYSACFVDNESNYYNIYFKNEDTIYVETEVGINRFDSGEALADYLNKNNLNFDYFDSIN